MILDHEAEAEQQFSVLEYHASLSCAQLQVFCCVVSNVWCWRAVSMSQTVWSSLPSLSDTWLTSSSAAAAILILSTTTELLLLLLQAAVTQNNAQPTIIIIIKVFSSCCLVQYIFDIRRLMTCIILHRCQVISNRLYWSLNDTSHPYTTVHCPLPQEICLTWLPANILIPAPPSSSAAADSSNWPDFYPGPSIKHDYFNFNNLTVDQLLLITSDQDWSDVLIGHLVEIFLWKVCYHHWSEVVDTIDTL